VPDVFRRLVYPLDRVVDRVIDPNILRSDPDRIRESQRRRGEDVAVVDEVQLAPAHARENPRRFR
jgi:seryl-tRNA synthetase